MKKGRKDKEEVLKRYQEELERTAKESLLNEPAVIPVNICDPFLENGSVLVDEKDGWMLVIQNPDYMRTDLPKYVPQFFVVHWRWDEWKPQEDIAKLIEEKFPFEKLMEMIDK